MNNSIFYLFAAPLKWRGAILVGISIRIAEELERGLSHPGPLEVVTRFNTAWEAGDLEGALAFVAEDAEYELHVSNEVLPFGGLTKGRIAIGETMRRMRADWEYILYRPLALAGHGDIVRFQVEFMYRHRASGEILSGRFRLVMRIENGLIVRADEYHDRAKVEAFMRLVGGSERR